MGLARYMRPMPTRLLPDDMLVFPSDGSGGYGPARMIRHVRFEMSDDVVGDEHRGSAVSGKIFVDAVNSKDAFEIPAGSKVLVNDLPRMYVKSTKRFCIVRGQIHHWELQVG
jgi:hypothetical protein